jgi:hypothetical protein
MANAFSKEERVAFEELGEKFEDALVMLSNTSVYRTDQTMMARANDTISRPMPYIIPSYDGTDQTNNFNDVVQLSVPAQINISKGSPWVMTAQDLRDALQEKRLGDAAMQRLATDINLAILGVACNQGTVFIKRTGAASGFDDVAAIDTAFNEQGVPQNGRYLALSSRDYNNMASNLAATTRSFGDKISNEALRRAYVGNVASFETFKLDYGIRKAAALGSAITISTLPAGGNVYVPLATSAAATGQASNVDNRFQRVTVNSTTNVAAGDAFTIANVNAVHHITKGDTGQLKTFRVISVDSATTMTISPPLITNQGGSPAERQYQNCVVTATSGTASIVFLNTAPAVMNPFWVKDAIEVLPGRLEMPTDAGLAVERLTVNVPGKTIKGVELVMSKSADINTLKTKYRLDVLFGVVNKQPQMSGIMMFSQL